MSSTNEKGPQAQGLKDTLYVIIGASASALGLAVLLIICCFYVPGVRKFFLRKSKDGDEPNLKNRLPLPPAHGALKKGPGPEMVQAVSSNLATLQADADSNVKDIGATSAAVAVGVKPAEVATVSQQKEKAAAPPLAKQAAPSHGSLTSASTDASSSLAAALKATSTTPTPGPAGGTDIFGRKFSNAQTAWGQVPGPAPRKTVSFTEQLQIPQLPPGVYSLGRTSNQLLDNHLTMPMSPGYGVPNRRFSGNYGGIQLPPLTPQQLQQLQQLQQMPPSQQAQALQSFYPMLYQQFGGF